MNFFIKIYFKFQFVSFKNYLERVNSLYHYQKLAKKYYQFFYLFQKKFTKMKHFFKCSPILAITLTIFVGLTSGNREHKVSNFVICVLKTFHLNILLFFQVHNIVLYPDKHSWCTTKQISQVISYPGCKQIVIDNNVCVGACFSYSIPQTEPSDPGEILGPYCDSCQPLETVWHHVTLDCSEQSNKNTDDEVRPPTMMKRVQIIKNCSCNSCNSISEKVCKIK